MFSSRISTKAVRGVKLGTKELEKGKLKLASIIPAGLVGVLVI